MRDDEEAPMRDRSEMRAAVAVPFSECDTLPSIPSVAPVVSALGDEEPAREIMQLEERLERLLLEVRDLTNERFALIVIADARAQRANECLQHARDARIIIRKYVDAVNLFASGVGGANMEAA